MFFEEAQKNESIGCTLWDIERKNFVAESFKTYRMDALLCDAQDKLTLKEIISQID